MDIGKVLDQLRKELQHLDAAIESLQRLHRKELRRGRPPKSRPRLKQASSLGESGEARKEDPGRSSEHQR
jgi:hypothetical protein